ncbi:zinc finger protein CONSTANS-LIKE 16-like [Aristolochia californica]|uniref:zinc finger protein CONSTANS-LIKE 16-like n=1 Tax=Aristolochia californica TaxID=171875 RepID=UPI0035DA1A29
MTSAERRNAAAIATASALGAKTARPCDICLRRRARWYCAADDAFLCQSCDSSVHSANQLASRHERVRLKTASSSLKLPSCDAPEDALPAWLHGLRRKARTPRNSKSGSSPPKTLLVPDLASDDHSNDDNEEQLLYRVPIFDPVLADFCSSSSPSHPRPSLEESKPPSAGLLDSTYQDNLPTGFLPSDVDLAEFAADVESLLGRGLDDEGFCMEGLGLLESRKEEMDWCFDAGRVKVEENDVDCPTISQADVEFDLSRDTLDLNFEYESPTTGGEEEEEKVAVAVNGYTEKGNKITLRLDYKAVIAAWASQGSPWTTGDRPHLNPDDAWRDCLGTFSSELHPFGEMGTMGLQAAAGDGGREARVSRYREKRRTRLFSKKIRYEVRKLNAEKRPRMKGRFVKRSSFPGSGFSF